LASFAFYLLYFGNALAEYTHDATIDEDSLDTIRVTLCTPFLASSGLRLISAAS
jgi:uncharacterized protein YfaP (DUF2135 family)